MKSTITLPLYPQTSERAERKSILRSISERVLRLWAAYLSIFGLTPDIINLKVTNLCLSLCALLLLGNADWYLSVASALWFIVSVSGFRHRIAKRK